MADARYLLRAIDRIEASLSADGAEELRVDEVADAACLSSFHFSRVFARAFAIGPWEWIVRRRLALAAESLASGKMDVTEACYSFAFSGPDVFARAMRRAYGLLPSELRKGLAPKRPYLERPSEPVIRLAADPRLLPSLAIRSFAAGAVRGPLIASAATETDGESFRQHLFMQALGEARAGGWECLVIRHPESGRGRSVYLAGSYAEGGGASMEALGPGRGTESVYATGIRAGDCAVCLVPACADLAVARAWFRGIALATAAFEADLHEELCMLAPPSGREGADTGAILRVPLPGGGRETPA